MSNNIVQLEDKDGNNVFPVAGSLAANSIETTMLKDGSVTSDKIDFTTMTYSTTEKRVGTDYDGKAIYERTFVADELTFAASTSQSFTLINASEVQNHPTEIINSFGYVAGVQYNNGPVLQRLVGSARVVATNDISFSSNVNLTSQNSVQLQVFTQYATPGTGYYRVTVRYKY